MKLIKTESVKLVHDNGDDLTPEENHDVQQIMTALKTGHILGSSTNCSDLVAMRIINVLSRKGFLINPESERVVRMDYVHDLPKIDIGRVIRRDGGTAPPRYLYELTSEARRYLREVLGYKL